MSTTDIQLTSETGTIAVTLRPLGATIQRIDFGGRDLVLGYDSSADQAECTVHPYFGTVGRVCNRIAGGAFSLAGNQFSLVCNNGPNALHGGPKGFDSKVWSLREQTQTSVVFECKSADGEEGFPLPLIASVSYTLNGNDLIIDYEAHIDEASLNGDEVMQDTIANLTTHSYFNLSGLDNPSILDHIVHFPNSLGHMELNSVQIPTGAIIKPDKLASMDFTSEPKTFGRDIAQVQEFKGYDHFYVVKDIDVIAADTSKKQELVLAATVKSPESGIKMEMLTDAIGFQLYTANFLESTIPTKSTHPKGTYGQHAGFCLETSAPPDAINSPNEKIRSTVIIKRGQKWTQKTIYRFSKD
ncbi:hypothetical protein HDU79_011293 [Rhizoclosmatium sp. JEL0117]|nr:hypothetical protein HDU79_011293 [Rhizoclosmatium sp. JEL0117]